MTQEVSAEWERLFRKAKIKRISARGLMEEMGDKSPSRASRILYQRGRLEPETLELAAKALKTTPAVIQQLRGRPVTEPYKPPRDADQLTDSQRRIVNGVIGEMVRLNERIRTLDKAQSLTGEDQGGDVDAPPPIDFAARRRALAEAGDDLPPTVEEIEADDGIAAREGETEAKRREREGEDGAE